VTIAIQNLLDESLDASRVALLAAGAIAALEETIKRYPTNGRVKSYCRRTLNSLMDESLAISETKSDKNGIIFTIITALKRLFHC